MVSLSMMARLVEAVRPDARLILVGDPEQLASVEAGAVLGDIVGPGHDRSACARRPETSSRRSPAKRSRRVDMRRRSADRRRHRRPEQGAPLRRGDRGVGRGDPAWSDADDAMAVLAAGDPDVQWIAGRRVASSSARGTGEVRSLAVECGRTVIEAAVAGDAKAAIAALGRFRLLCAHRRGPDGVATWMHHVESWLRAEVDGFSRRRGLVRRAPAHRDGERLRVAALQRRHRGRRRRRRSAVWPRSNGVTRSLG